MSDYISRQDALDGRIWVMQSASDSAEIEHLEAVPVEYLKELPSAQPESPERTAETAQNVSDSDLISRKAAIDAVLNLDTTHRVSWRDAVIDMIDAMPSADVQPVVHWISCSERLPKTHETGNSFSGIYMQSSPVLVYGVPEYEEEYGFHVVTYCDDKNGHTYWSTELDAVTINEVYAWQPLPEPYQKGADE